MCVHMLQTCTDRSSNDMIEYFVWVSVIGYASVDQVIYNEILCLSV